MSSHDDREHVQITEDEVERFVAKLEEWGEQLPEEEKRLLRLMLSSALATAEASGDVEGFDLAVFSRQTPRTFSVAAASLAARLGDLADTMSDQDRRTFATLLLNAMDPVSKRRWQPVEGLRPDEVALLESLAVGSGARSGPVLAR